MIIKRELETKLKQLAKKFPLVALNGPRQSGKSTLVKMAFPSMTYISLEDLDNRLYAEEDPRGFLDFYKDGAIFDEIQKVPQLFSYLQTHVDQYKKNGQFILTGSQNFLLNEKISQTLAGRVAMLTLLPFSLTELEGTRYNANDLDSFLYKGFYPRIYDQNISPNDWYPAYLQTYVERDVRMIKNVSNLSQFQKFIKILSGRVGQLLNFSSLANDCDITHNTAKSWLSVLESSFLIFLLRPHYKNFNKRLVKMPKIYFYDVGLASFLLGIEDKNQLATNYLRGNLFENFIISELVKQRFNHGKLSNLYFWRDKLGHEIDCLIEEEINNYSLVEIKSGKTVKEDFFKNISYWNNLASKEIRKNNFVIYTGKQEQKRKNVQILPWEEMALLKSDYKK